MEILNFVKKFLISFLLIGGIIWLVASFIHGDAVNPGDMLGKKVVNTEQTYYRYSGSGELVEGVTPQSETYIVNTNGRIGVLVLIIICTLIGCSKEEE